MKKIKITKKMLYKGLILSGILIIAAFLLFQASDSQRPNVFDGSITTAQKFDFLKKWVPDQAVFIAVADIQRLSATPYLKKFFEEGLLKGDDQTIVAIRSMLFGDDGLSMLVFSGDLGEEKAGPQFNIIVQDDFVQKEFLESVKQELAKQGASLDSDLVGKIRIYWQAGMEEPFAFSLPDKKHLLIGTKDSLIKILTNVDQEKNFDFETKDSSFFGRLTSSANLQQYLPPQIASLTLATFTTDDQGRIKISLYLPDMNQAKNLEMFLLGMKALYMLQMQNQQAEQEVFGAIAISSQNNVVIIEAPLEELIKVSLQAR
ncbi:MAG: hypothetical protein ABH859_05290 [Pseudomonadota bacterium]